MQNIRIDNAKANILCVDDDPQLLRHLARLLVGAGHTVDCCVNAAAALTLAPQRTPDLIIADIDLGGHDGLDMVQQLGQVPGLAEVPVLFLSDAEIPDVVRRSRAAGGTFYLRKPVDSEVLLELVNKALWMPHIVRNHMHAAQRARQNDSR